MPYCSWDDENFETLIHAIHQQDCILMLGPDAATQDIDGQPQPLTRLLAGELAAKLPPETCAHIDCSDLTQAAQYYQNARGRSSLEAKVKRFYEAKQELTSPLHRDLAALPFPLTITTTPDAMFVRALQEQQKEPVTARYHFRDKNPTMTETPGTLSSPLVYRLYGCLEQPASLLLTENDMLDFLVALIAKRPLPKNIASQLRDSRKCFLFMGFGFRHWYLRILLHVLRGEDNKNNFSFALEDFIPADTDALRQTVYFYKQGKYKVDIYKYDEGFSPFARRLREDFEAYEKSTEPARQGGQQREAITGRTVFICHASEDEKHAAELYGQLAQKGFRPWLDKEQLRGGVNWDHELKTVLATVDNIVVLQSNALEEKRHHEHYINLEIDFALERSRKFPKRSGLIFPVRIEECPLHPDLEYLQSIDLTQPDGLEQLCKTLRRTAERRRTN